MDALRGLPLSFAEDRLWRLQSENHSPHPMNLSNALLAFREEVERGHIDGLEWKLPRAKDGTICKFNVHELALTDISFRAADVHLDGAGVDKDGREAIRWLFLAADKGHLQAEALLGQTLFTGREGVPPQRALGLMWLTLAREAAIEFQKG